MADRTMTAGDTYPPLRGAAAASGVLLDLSGAQALQARARAPVTGSPGVYYLVTGVAVADTPPVQETNADATVSRYNWHYDFAVGDMAHPGLYNVELVVTWAPGKVQTFTGPVILVTPGSTSS